MKLRRIHLLLAALALVVLGIAFRPWLGIAFNPFRRQLGMMRTIEERLDEYGQEARARLGPYFERAGTAYPPHRLALLAFKQERLLEVQAANEGDDYRWIRTCRILGSSGEPGPKLREGDRQVPEGIYSIQSLNPNSRFHVSLRIDYPNAFDREHGEADGRTDLGGDIMIHGGTASVGCLAMGDEAAEDLFVLAAETGLSNILVIISPVDFRNGRKVSNTGRLPSWAAGLHARIEQALDEFPVNADGGL